MRIAGRLPRRALATVACLALAAALLSPPAIADDGSPASDDARPQQHGDAAVDERRLVTVPDAGNVDDAEDALRRALGTSGEVERISDRVLAATGARDEVEAAVADWPTAVEDNGALVAATAPKPNDPYFDRQWALHNTGQTIPHTAGTAGEPGIDIGALEAWGHTAGGHDVLVAVIDHRVEPHEDLWPNVLQGKSFAPSGPCKPTHGTEVSGVVAAVRDNERGVAGLAPRVRVLAVPFLPDCTIDEEGNPIGGTFEDAISAIGWAADNGARVIVASWGTRPQSEPPAGLRAAIEDAGIPVIAAAGNHGLDLSGSDTSNVYPASLDLRNLLSVAGIDESGHLHWSSNRGVDDVELAAPGVDVYTATFDMVGDDAYEYRTGTSFAAPYVAAGVALAMSLRPVLTSEAILDLTLDTVMPLEDLDGRVATGGTLDAGHLVRAIATAGACPTEEVPDGGLTDVADASPHALAVDCLAWWEITRGKSAGIYASGDPVTRGQMATFLGEVIAAGPGLPDEPPSAFTDTDTSVHRERIDALAALEIVRGFRDGTYRPSEPVTRAQMATFLVNAYEYLRGQTAPQPDGRWFTDTEGLVHADAAESLWQLGITAGTAPRTYDPRPDVRRDQMASFVARLLDLVVRAGDVPLHEDVAPPDDDSSDDGGTSEEESSDDGDATAEE